MTSSPSTVEQAAALHNLPCEVRVPPEVAASVFRSGVAQPSYDEKRQFARFYYGTEASRIGVRFLNSIPALPRESAWKGGIPLDISRGGLQLLFGQQLYPGERLRFAIDKGSKLLMLDGEVVWCRRLAQQCYSIGIRFLGSS